MRPTIFAKLSVMMLLEYFIWGAWYVTMGTYMSQFLGSSGLQIGAAYSALAIATMISPFFVGMIADRFFAAQRIMGALHIAGGVLLFLQQELQTIRFLLGHLVLLLVVYANHRFVQQHCLSPDD